MAIRVTAGSSNLRVRSTEELAPKRGGDDAARGPLAQRLAALGAETSTEEVGVMFPYPFHPIS